MLCLYKRAYYRRDIFNFPSPIQYYGGRVSHIVETYNVYLDGSIKTYPLCQMQYLSEIENGLKLKI